MKRRLPPNDQELAAAELTENARRQSMIEEYEEQDRTERIAQAGEPEALLAISAFEHSQPIPAPPAPKSKKVKPAPVAASKPVETPMRPRPLTDKQDEAFQLMDLAFRKFTRDFRKDGKKARESLALDLVQDSVIYMKTGIWRSDDPLDAINKLTGAVSRAKDEPEGEDELERELEQFRALVRG